MQKDKICVVMPGVPAEMKQMMKQSVLSMLLKKYQAQLGHVEFQTIRTTGIYESKLYETLSPTMEEGTLAKWLVKELDERQRGVFRPDEPIQFAYQGQSEMGPGPEEPSEEVRLSQIIHRCIFRPDVHHRLGAERGAPEAQDAAARKSADLDRS